MAKTAERMRIEQLIAQASFNPAIKQRAKVKAAKAVIRLKDKQTKNEQYRSETI